MPLLVIGLLPAVLPRFASPSITTTRWRKVKSQSTKSNKLARPSGKRKRSSFDWDEYLLGVSLRFSAVSDSVIMTSGLSRDRRTPATRLAETVTSNLMSRTNGVMEADTDLLLRSRTPSLGRFLRDLRRERSNYACFCASWIHLEDCDDSFVVVRSRYDGLSPHVCWWSLLLSLGVFLVLLASSPILWSALYVDGLR